jgi:hypothetical protein
LRVVVTRAKPNANYYKVLVVVYTNLMVQLSRIYGHEIHVVSYACIDGDCLLYWSRLCGLYTNASFPPD